MKKKLNVNLILLTSILIIAGSLTIKNEAHAEKLLGTYFIINGQYVKVNDGDNDSFIKEQKLEEEIKKKLNINNDYTFGDRYNKAEKIRRNNEDFQKTKEGLDRKERADGTDGVQRELFRGNSNYEINKPYGSVVQVESGNIKLDAYSELKEHHTWKSNYDTLSDAERKAGYGNFRVNEKGGRVAVMYENTTLGGSMDSSYIKYDKDLNICEVGRIIKTETNKQECYDAYGFNH